MRLIMKKEWEHKFHTGNVIKDPQGDLWIVVEVRDHGDRPSIEAIAFSYSNVTATQLLEDHDDKRHCACECYGPGDEYEGHDPECSDCHGTGTYIVHVKGWKRAKVMAQCVKDFILQGTKRQFEMD